MTRQSPLAFLPYMKKVCLSLCIFVGVFVCFLWPGWSSQEREADILIPVDPHKIPEGLTLVGPPLKEIEVRVRGPIAALKDLSANRPSYILDLSSVTVGVESIPINPELIQMPEGIIITSINPAYLTVRVDHQLKKELAVMVSVSGKSAANFFIADAVAKPSTVVVCGPENVLSPIEEILTKPIDVTGRSESFKKEIALDLAEDLKICSSSGIVLAEIYLAESVVSKLFQNIPVKGTQTPFNFSITPRTINIEIKGPKNTIENLNPEKDIRVFVELEELKPGVYVRRAAITLPVKITLMNVKPELFTVKITD